MLSIFSMRKARPVVYHNSSLDADPNFKARRNVIRTATFRPIISHHLTESDKSGIIPTAYGEKSWLAEQLK